MKQILIILVLTSILGLNVSAQKGLAAGAKAPTFMGVDQNGNKIDLQNILKKHQSVVLFFYRGQWCPYCNKQIKELQDSLQLLTAKNAYVIGVTPETADNIAKTIKKTKAGFSIIQDKDDEIMKAYGVNFMMDDATFAKYKGFGVDLEMNNGNTRHTLPVPATYIIDRSGKIKFVYFDPNYKKRASISNILTQL
ncbi:peroxiredoxin-like family protein [Pedobacter sandarakinus]|uniref:peroxiredoxin-like family protein n=1 Tax=Pedobacter sandarakinus TaxID=353156 RepID=UPI0022470C70|nr:peroxiredoxin-like family protein [Pedobacter sandarakinus]MCX2574777.1 peroxiredoxin-like family protein [Pedobacter sandarakinus]